MSVPPRRVGAGDTNGPRLPDTPLAGGVEAIKGTMPMSEGCLTGPPELALPVVQLFLGPESPGCCIDSSIEQIQGSRLDSRARKPPPIVRRKAQPI